MILESRLTDFVGLRMARDGKIKGKLVNGLPKRWVILKNLLLVLTPKKEDGNIQKDLYALRNVKVEGC